MYDATTNGTACYSNLTTITTDQLGKWQTEQYGIGTVCNDSTKDYYLAIGINNEIQSPRKLLKSFSYLRKDVSEKIKNTLTISTELVGGIGASSLVLNNVKSGPTAVTVIRLVNDIGKFVTIAMGSNLTNIAGVTGNQASLSYTGGNIFVFSSLNSPNIWRWRKTFSPSINNVTTDDLMDLTSNGSLILYHGNFIVNGLINGTGNMVTNGSINAGGNVTSSYFLGDGSQLTNLPSGNATSKNYTHLSNFTNDIGFINSTQAQVYNDTLFITSVNNTLENNKVPYTGAIRNVDLGNFNLTANTGFFSSFGSVTSRINDLFTKKIDASESIKLGFTEQETCNSSTEGTIIYAAGNGNKREFQGCRQKSVGEYEWVDLS